MSKKKIQISIPQPCNEGWENMRPEEKGRFCLTCQKSLIDFSNFSDSQVISILEKSNGKICGRFSKNQLNKVLEEENINSQNRLMKVAGFLLPFLISNSVKANFTQNTFQSIQIQENFFLPSQIEVRKHFPTDSSKFIVFQVIDKHTFEPLPFVSIYLDNTPVSTTDFEGNVKIQVTQVNKSIRFNLVGYESKNIDLISINIEKVCIVELNSVDQLIEGAVIITRNKPKWWQFRKKRTYKMQLLEND